MPDVLFSCFADDTPRFRLQALQWIWTILDSGTARPEEIVVHLADGRNAGFLHALAHLGVKIRRVSRFGTGDAAYCNKLQQLQTPDFRDVDVVVLCDTDLAFAGDIRPWVTPDAVSARIVDLPNPPLERLERLYARTCLPASPKIVPTAFSPDSTFQTNCNGGLYFVPSRWLDSLAYAWIKWARMALDQGDILGMFQKHADQIGFCFAMLDLGLPFQPLPGRLNFPIHLPLDSLSYEDYADPLVLHYHWRTDASGFLLPTGALRVDAAIERVNDMLRNRRRKSFASEVFWDYRYAHHSDLGSGLGSRGGSLDYRRGLLCPIISEFSRRDILDVGCGDLEVLAPATADGYTGLDTSPEAIAIARAKRPDWTFIVGDISAVEEQAFDLVLCGSVLIHIPEREAYLDLVRRLVDRCQDTLVIEAYNAPPVLTSEITFYYEPISETLERDPRVREIRVIGRYRDTEIVRARVG